VKNM